MSDSLESAIKQRAGELGFDPVGITSLGPARTYAEFRAWLDQGYSGEMTYLPRGADKRRDTRLPFEGVRSAIVVGLNYGGKQPAGTIARYARGADYHDVMTARLRELHRWLESETNSPIAGKAYVDTGPILERDLAQRAGLGWIGKNTMLIHPRRGSFFFLGALLIDLDLQTDAPFDADRCGSCTRCLDACPTDAFVAPRTLDATRCISYLTIEHRSAIAVELQPLMGSLIYGCDICQDVCPWNRFEQETDESRFMPRKGNVSPALSEIIDMTHEQYVERFRGSAMKRAKLTGLQRNAKALLPLAR